VEDEFEWHKIYISKDSIRDITSRTPAIDKKSKSAKFDVDPNWTPLILHHDLGNSIEPAEKNCIIF